MRSALTRNDRYDFGAIWFHWSIALLVIINLALGLFHETLLDGFVWVMPVHKALGLTILALTAGRIVWRLAHRPPPLQPMVAAWERLAAATVHFLLYGLMLALPLTGWVMVSGAASRRALQWFGLFDIPYLPVSQAAGATARGAHGLLGWMMLALVVLHVGAALRHHFLRRDAILARMIPRLRPRS